MQKILLTIITVLVLAGAGFWLFAGEAGLPAQTGETWEFKNPLAPKEYTLLFVGDIMLDRGVDHANRTRGTDAPTYPFELIADILREEDLTIGNLEGPISDKGRNVGSEYSFRMDPTYIKGLTFAGFDVLFLANNHMLDYTGAALVDTVERLTAAGIGTAGAGANHAAANAPHIEELPGGTRIAFLSYTNLMPESFISRGQTPGLSDPAIESIKSTIRGLTPDADITVLLWHWGDEYEPRSHPREQQIARELIDAGADLIVGHHPHVAQEIETYKRKTIAYSLGNFIFDQYFSPETMRGLMLKVTVKDGEITSAEPIDIQLTDTYQPYVVDSR